MRAGGRINILGLLTIIGVVGAGYWAAIFGPAYLERFDVQEVISAACSRVANGDDVEVTKETVIAKLNVIGQHVETDEEGKEVTMPGLGVDEESVQVSFNAGTAAVAVRYRKLFILKPTSNRVWDDFYVEKIRKSGQ